jgi:hypothetical protein
VVGQKSNNLVHCQINFGMALFRPGDACDWWGNEMKRSIVTFALAVSLLSCGTGAPPPPITPQTIPISGMWEFSSTNTAAFSALYLEANLQQNGDQVVAVS